MADDARGIELNLGLGVANVSYEDQTLLRIGLSNGRVVPITPTLHRERYGVEAIRTEFLIGRRVNGPVHLKGGVIYDFTGDMHPFQALVLLAVQVR